MKQESLVGQSTRILLIIFSLFYLAFCIAAGLEKWREIHQLAVHFFILLAVVLVLRQLILFFGAFIYANKKKNIATYDDELPVISIIMPAYNEAETINSALASLNNINYPNLDIIIIDDGSQDNTLDKINLFIKDNNHKNSLQVISQSNAGKAHALNTGLLHAIGDFILCVDADSHIQSDSLLYGIAHFDDPKLGAIAGNVMLANEQQNLLTRLQQLEYLISQNFIRRGLALWGVVSIIPGPVGLFRKEAIAEVGGYREDKDLFAEDADITVRLLAKGWVIKSEERLVAYTEAPEKIFPLLRQRYRWKRGIYQVLHDNFYRLVTANNQRARFLEILLISEGFLLEVLGFGVTLFMVTNILATASINLLLAWLALLFFLDFIILLLATPLRDLWKSLPLLVLQKLTYSYALQTWGVLSLLDEWRSTQMSWDKVERTGRLPMEKR